MVKTMDFSWMKTLPYLVWPGVIELITFQMLGFTAWNVTAFVHATMALVFYKHSTFYTLWACRWLISQPCIYYISCSNIAINVTTLTAKERTITGLSSWLSDLQPSLRYFTLSNSHNEEKYYNVLPYTEDKDAKSNEKKSN